MSLSEIFCAGPKGRTMSDSKSGPYPLEQRIQTALDLLTPQDDGCNHICSDNCVEGCFVYRVICDMIREREVLKQQRDCALKILMSSRSALFDVYKPLDNSLGDLLKIIAEQTKESECQTF